MDPCRDAESRDDKADDRGGVCHLRFDVEFPLDKKSNTDI